MNPCEIELGTSAYLADTIDTLAGTQFLAAVNTAEMDPEKPAVVARAESLEFRSTTCFVGTVEVAVRTPASAYSREDHSALVAAVAAAMNDQSSYVTGFNAATTGIDLIGSAPVNFRAPTFEDRAWVNVISVGIGIITS
jgi:hypothetical protein